MFSMFQQRHYLTVFISVNFNMKCFKMKIVSCIQSCIDKQKLHGISNSVLNHLLLHLQKKINPKIKIMWATQEG